MAWTHSEKQKGTNCSSGNTQGAVVNLSLGAKGGVLTLASRIAAWQIIKAGVREEARL